MQVQIEQAQTLSNNILRRFGFSDTEANYITENLLEGELTNKKTHGFVRLLYIKKLLDNGKGNLEPLDTLEVISETNSSLYIDGKYKLGIGVIYQSLKISFEKMRDTKILAVGIKDLELTGYIGDYARKATEHDLIFIGFNNSTGGLVPFGAKKDVWGTNPLTIGVPSNNIPVILDMASSKKTYGDLIVAKNEGKTIENGVAIDKEGNMTNDPEQAMQGGLLPFAGHKGSGLAFIVELLGGALTGSRCGYNVPGGWGSFYILIDPTIFRPIQEFKKDVDTAIEELKTAPPAGGFDAVYFAGEQSYKSRLKYLETGSIELSDKLYSDLQSLLA